MRTDSGHFDAPADALDRVWLATRPTDPNVSWDAFWSEVSAQSDAARRRGIVGGSWNDRRKVFVKLAFGLSTLAAAAVLCVVFSSIGARVDRSTELVDAAAKPSVRNAPPSAERNDNDAPLQDVSVDSGRVLVLRIDEHGRLRTDEAGWEPSLAIGDSAYGYGASDDSFEFIGYLEALGLDSVAVGRGKSETAPLRTP